MGATLIRASDAPSFDVHGAKVIAYASPSRGSGSLATWRVTLDTGAKSPRHSLDVDEVFVCLGGAAEFHVGTQTLRVAAGDAITVAAGTEFDFAALGAEPFEAFACVRAGARARVEGGEPFEPPWAV
jgi:mannose-6-phosphate isomerase-like protein (cupin superfamily)